MIKRIFDILLAINLITIGILPLVAIGLVIKCSSKGPIIHWSKRNGRDNKIFFMPKFRTMSINAPDVATHLLSDSDKYIGKVGNILRKTSIDELPQLVSILYGKMSFVGPRPALHNQYDLIELRNKYNIDKLMPGITGLAQINGRDELDIPNKVRYDLEYMQKQSFFFDIKILLFTVLRIFKRTNITH